MQFKHLLAKSCEDPENPPFEATLVGHTQAVIEAFRALFGAIDQPTRLSLQWLNFFNLPKSIFNLFFLNGLAACVLHDLGKAVSGFQSMIRRMGRQQLRHEHVSAIFLLSPGIRDWIKSIDSLNERIILSAILGHHLKAIPRNRDFACYLEGIDQPRFSLDTDLLEKNLSELTAQVPELPGRPDVVLLPEKWNLDDEKKINDGMELHQNAKELLKKFDRALKNDKKLHCLLMAVRSGLILADSAGSGLVREGKDIKSWLHDAFREEDLLTDGIINSDILIPRKHAIEATSGQLFVWQDFQKAAGNLPDRALLLSSCGSGKTLAAWRWISSRLARKPAGRAIFLYPTKATASEGFRDYVSWAPEGILLHSSSSFDLQGMFENPDERPESGKFLVEERLFALAYWHRRIFSATVHQFLGFMQNSYRSICLLPLLADSVVVIDEVHSFNTALFSALKQFLANFNVPVLCMTATLPQQRQKEFAELGLEIFPQDPSAFSDLFIKSAALRYKVRFLGESQEYAEMQATEALEQGKKILWVVNTVDRCQILAKKFNAICYHSRFKLADRQVRHKDVIDAFQSDSGPLLAITTQVCEMSLDLDADVLISETAPITSLIQRMGRCNRHLKNDMPGKVYFYIPEDEKPYSQEDMIGVYSFVRALDNKVVSQQDLDTLLVEFGNNAREFERYSAFLRDRAWANSREKELADIKETSVQAILDADIGKFFEMRKNHQPFDGLLLPVPRFPDGLMWKNKKIGRFPLVASVEHYHPQYGFAKYPWEGIL